MSKQSLCETTSVVSPDRIDPVSLFALFFTLSTFAEIFLRPPASSSQFWLLYLSFLGPALVAFLFHRVVKRKLEAKSEARI
jgi:hypothetical protein